MSGVDGPFKQSYKRSLSDKLTEFDSIGCGCGFEGRAVIFDCLSERRGGGAGFASSSLPRAINAVLSTFNLYSVALLSTVSSSFAFSAATDNSRNLSALSAASLIIVSFCD